MIRGIVDTIVRLYASSVLILEHFFQVAQLLIVRSATQMVHVNLVTMVTQGSVMDHVEVGDNVIDKLEKI